MNMAFRVAILVGLVAFVFFVGRAIKRLWENHGPRHMLDLTLWTVACPQKKFFYISKRGVIQTPFM